MAGPLEGGAPGGCRVDGGRAREAATRRLGGRAERSGSAVTQRSEFKAVVTRIVTTVRVIVATVQVIASNSRLKRSTIPCR